MFIRPNGHTYEGNWENGKQHGQGWLTKNGERRLFQWDMGKRIKELKNEGAYSLPPEQHVDQSNAAGKGEYEQPPEQTTSTVNQ